MDMDRDREGLLNAEGLWNKRGALLGGLIVLAVIVGFNYFYFEQMLGALGLFTAFWLLLLAVVFVLVLAEHAAEWALRRLARAAAPSLHAAEQVDVGAHLLALRHWLAQAAKPLPKAARQLHVVSRLSVFRRQLRASVSRWRWGMVAWAEIPSVSRIDEWRRARARTVRTRLQQHRHRHVA